MGKRVLIVGSNGLLGQKVTDLLLRGSAYTVSLASKAEKPIREVGATQYMAMDITSRKDVKHVIFLCEPDIIINAAAMTNVDACEKERELAWRINVGGVQNIIEAARKNDAEIVHISTDYVFNGKAGPYEENEQPDPLNYYGRSKLASENELRTSGLNHCIIRTMVLYGFAQGVKSNFALWLIQNLEKKLAVRVVNDQYGNPTLADDLAHGIMSALELGRSGIYNIAGREIISRHEFAVRLAEVFGFDSALIIPVKTSDVRQPAARPLKSGLITLKAEVELGIKPSTVEQGVTVLKSQMSRNAKKVPDSAPVPGSSSSRKSSLGKY
ncbi:MAG: dTDP-4-dehydrorhamnose reductase [Ignavibacteria bacterium]|nr:dTDP-4-dehydrorhamnose reductase [Ignavibacteria bacterium]